MQSYPYLNLCQAFELDYGDCLCFVDAYEKKFKRLNVWEKKSLYLQGTATAQAIIERHKAEMERRKHVNIGNGGHSSI